MKAVLIMQVILSVCSQDVGLLIYRRLYIIL